MITDTIIVKIYMQVSRIHTPKLVQNGTWVRPKPVLHETAVIPEYFFLL
jgi:hypothetical protein